jgi:two-component system sensor histidine kinase YesM
VQVISYYNIISILQKNIDVIESNNLVQTQRNIQTKLGFYEDLLYRIYTDDEIVKLIDNINAGNELEINNSQLRHVLHEYIYTMPYIQSITILMSSGNMVFDDVLTGYNTKTSWLDTSDDRPEKLFRQIASKDTLKIMSSHVVSYFSSKKYYLFHIAHRIIDYRNIYKKNGVVILSIDEKMLSDICAEQQTEKNAHDKSCIVILGADGTVISYPDKSKIGTRLPLPKDPEEKRRLIGTMVSGNANHGGNNLSIYEVEDEKTGWNIFLVRDRKALYQEITNQQKLTIFVIVLSVCALLAIILLITRRLTQSIDTVVRAMNMAGEGKLSVRIEKDRRMPLEMEKIADNFNLMVRKINELIEDVHAASIKQKNAEIRALEAQVNPHFLYNTLDTINWMAIDKNEFEISNAINALARILRYSIDNSNGVVKIRREVEWLKQYIFLQQTRLKNSFESCLKIAPAVLDCHIHKLLLQPFVENAIIHGFENSEQKQILLIEISKPEDVISILIKDNGSGIEQELLEQINAGNYEFLNKKGQLGIFNAMERFRMYYGERVHIDIQSTEGRGTAVHIEYTEIEG